MLEIKISKLPIQTTGRRQTCLNPSYNFTRRRTSCVCFLLSKASYFQATNPCNWGKRPFTRFDFEKLIYIFNKTKLLCCWNIWKHRHECMTLCSCGENPSLSHLQLACCEDTRLWSYRLLWEEADIASIWWHLFSPMWTNLVSTL